MTARSLGQLIQRPALGADAGPLGAIALGLVALDDARRP